MIEPRLAVRALAPLISGLRALGHDPAPLLAAAGLDEGALNDPDCRVPMGDVVRFLQIAADRTRDANLGLHLAERAELGSADLHFYAMASSATLGDAYERLQRYQRLIHDTSRIELTVDRGTAVLRHRLAGGLAAPRHSAEFLIAAWVRTGRAVTARDWTPIAVRFAHAAPTNVEDHVRFFRAPVHFATGENAVVLPAELLAWPCAQADPTLNALIDRHAVDRLKRAPATPSVLDRVRSAIEDELPGGEPRASRVAARLRMSTRTLNRTLAAEGSSFRALLDTGRRDLALHHLAGGELSVAEIAFLLGFSELSAFHRAFKRWTGETPVESRRRLRVLGTAPARPR